MPGGGYLVMILKTQQQKTFQGRMLRKMQQQKPFQGRMRSILVTAAAGRRFFYATYKYIKIKWQILPPITNR